MMQGWIAGLVLLMQMNEMTDQTTKEGSSQIQANVQREAYRLDYVDVPLVNNERLDRLMTEMEKKAYRKPVNATISDAGGIVKEIPGAQLNRRAFVEQFYKQFYSEGPMKFDVPTLPIYPKVDSELLASIRVHPIGYYVTYFNSNNKHRFTNIKLATQAINNYVVLPNETFSFNRVVGVRTRGRGYMPAKVIVRGEFSEGIGGGICQTSSTLFNAVDRAGLTIVERYSHSRSVPYVPSGRDATVNWGGPDFSFKNNYNQPILIRAQALPGRVYVSIYSSELINHKPRHVPGASKTIPEEITAGADAENSNP
ncbi:VanW family protein [Paenibacillus chondroitinus]|uniref:VanW family protein n=1 Tax=Paenibacillus chondroitinus TaxID=59842 RepID=A0ABU6DDL9_9BACL|nr:MULTISPECIES: VanW family protein [Paenibacillus]MCY9662852.1 VanW family protein [Paenibacillus anseongense]MEB4794991.1 VanW family protein [Paenibacillus chondroitinus]